MKNKTTVTVLENKNLTDNIHSMTLQYRPEEKPKGVLPGQFVGVYVPEESMILPRPISICDYDEESGQMRLVFRENGEGTKKLGAVRAQETLGVLGVLGNGYPTEDWAGKHILLLGGGIGIPPMVYLAKTLVGLSPDTRVSVALGYHDRNLFLNEDFPAECEILLATEDGSFGVSGNVLDAVRVWKEETKDAAADITAACGAPAMLRAVKNWAKEEQIPCYFSLEERMACGVGVCLGCVAKTTKKDAHSGVNNARICTEGPVFLADDVEL